MSLPAPNFRLRPGWHPDPTGEDAYRYFDGYDWTEMLVPVPDARRSRFAAHREALERLADAADEVHLHVVTSRTPGGSHDPSVPDAGRSAAIIGLVLGVFGLWPAALWFSRISRVRSAAQGRPRSGLATAALAAGLFAGVWTTGLVVLLLVIA